MYSIWYKTNASYVLLLVLYKIFMILVIILLRGEGCKLNITCNSININLYHNKNESIAIRLSFLLNTHFMLEGIINEVSS